MCIYKDKIDTMVYGLQNTKKAFTLAEALIVLVIIGVIAALTIPAILANTEQHEYKTALKKAVSMLNQAIELNIALEGYGPIEVESGGSNAKMNTNYDSLYNFFRKRMNVVTTSDKFTGGGGTGNATFYTADGMRYEFPEVPAFTGNPFNMTNSKCARPPNMLVDEENVVDDAGNHPTLPCVVIVDVNGDRKPNPRRSGENTSYKVPAASNSSKLMDVFPVMITDVSATPWGLVAQRAMFSHK